MSLTLKKINGNLQNNINFNILVTPSFFYNQSYKMWIIIFELAGKNYLPKTAWTKNITGSHNISKIQKSPNWQVYFPSITFIAHPGLAGYQGT